MTVTKSYTVCIRCVQLLRPSTMISSAVPPPSSRNLKQYASRPVEAQRTQPALARIQARTFGRRPSGRGSRAAPGFESPSDQEFGANEDTIQKEEQDQREDEQSYAGEVVKQALDRIDADVVGSQDQCHDTKDVRQNGDWNNGQDQDQLTDRMVMDKLMDIENPYRRQGENRIHARTSVFDHELVRADHDHGAVLRHWIAEIVKEVRYNIGNPYLQRHRERIEKPVGRRYREYKKRERKGEDAGQGPAADDQEASQKHRNL